MKNKILSAVIAAMLLLCLCGPAAFAASMDNFVPSKTYAGSYEDVTTDQWYYDNVKTCYEYGLMIGTSVDGSIFEPETYLARSEAIVMADRIYMIYNEGNGSAEAGLKADEGQEWYEKFVQYAIDHGIIKEGDFTDYDKYITRAEMAYIFANALPSGELDEINEITSVPDVALDSKYAEEIYALYRAGVVIGNDIYGSYYPDLEIIRAEAGAIISRLALKNLRLELIQYENYRIDTSDTTYLTIDVPTAFEKSSESSTIDIELKNGECITCPSTDVLLSGTVPNTLAVSTNIMSHVLFSGLSIDIYTAEEIENMYMESFSQDDDVLAIPTCEVTKITFGDIPVYRCALTVDYENEDGSTATVYSYNYTYIVDDAFVDISFVSNLDNASFKSIVNSLKIMDSSTSSLL